MIRKNRVPTAKKVKKWNRKIAGIQMPAQMTADRQRTGIRRAFINTVVPELEPIGGQEKDWAAKLQLNLNAVQCVYCGDEAKQLDHFRKLTENELPTGYITDIFNLVPCCGTCNSSKNGPDWKKWMLGQADKGPRKRTSEADLLRRVAILDEFAEWSEALTTRLDVVKIIGEEAWKRYEDDMTAVIRHLGSVRDHSVLFSEKIRAHLAQEKKLQAVPPTDEANDETSIND
jgi:5-methylcytosine-specific restriction endonuclease McrA